MPHVTMMRLIHLRALQRSTMSAPGTSSSTYPRKKIPKPVPKISSSKPRSFAIVSFANAMFVRSMYAIA